jgi:hypothetical protein
MTRSPAILVRDFDLIKKDEQEALQKNAADYIKQLPALLGFALGAVFIVIHWAVLQVLKPFQWIFRTFS